VELFEHARRQEIERGAPLAARMRPRTLDEYAGQEHVIGPGRLLRRAIQADQISSLIFYGPPGTGKTTLAMVIANTTRSHFVTLNAVLAGVGELREVTRRAQEDLSLYGQRTTLFVDEVHRWNRAQQDALLPWVENGTIIMIGATTENPWFSVNRPLLSRSRVFQLKPLGNDDLVTIAHQALNDPERGYGALAVDLRPDALDHLVNVSNGDARSLLNALELAVETTPPNEQGVIVVTRFVAEESIQQRAVLYDREGDYHFDTISAFIKSLRGSDPDAALYWLAKMVYAGEDPRFMFRRMLILASEDVGLADPQALTVVESAAAAFERIGLPEGQFHLTQAALYLATAPKSNSALAYFDALEVVKAEKDAEVPSHLRDASRDKESFGHGEGYLYPHAYRDHWVAQQYLPDALQGQLFYQPSDQGYERQIKDQVARRREEQLAAVIEGPTYQQEVLTFSPSNRREERWLARTISDAGRSLGDLRDHIFQRAVLLRHHLVLDLNAGSGLLTWEAVRRVPEGGVWCLAWDQTAFDLMTQQAAALPELRRPLVVLGTPNTIVASLGQAGHPSQRFDVIVGRSALTRSDDRAAVFRALADRAQPGAQLSLAEVVPRLGQRLYDLVPPDDVQPELLSVWREAEEAIYNAPGDPMTNWEPDYLRAGLEEGGWQDVELLVEKTRAEHLFTRSQLDRWFASAGGDRPTYAMHLAQRLTPEQVAAIEGHLRRQLQDQSVPWHSTIAYLTAHRPSAERRAE
jgi:putative ATPase